MGYLNRISSVILKSDEAMLNDNDEMLVRLSNISYPPYW